MAKKRSLDGFEFDKPTKKTLAMLKQKTRWTKKDIVQRAIHLAQSNPAFFKIV